MGELKSSTNNKELKKDYLGAIISFNKKII